MTLTEAGFSLSGGGGTLAQGCSTLGAAGTVTVPSIDGNPDWATFTRCVSAVKAVHPGEVVVTFSAAGTMPFALVAQTMVALEGSEATPLFPLVLLTRAL